MPYPAEPTQPDPQRSPLDQQGVVDRSALLTTYGANCRDLRDSIFDNTNREAMMSIRDVLLHAAAHDLDVSMLVSSLRSSTRSKLFTEATKDAANPTGYNFVDLLSRVLDRKRRVRILIWNVLKKDLISEEICRLIEERGHDKLDSLPGHIDVRLSGSIQHVDRVCHFVCAHKPGALPEQWMLRVEAPHAIPDPLDTDAELESPCHKAVLFKGSLAYSYAAPHLEHFDTAFASIARGWINRHQGISTAQLQRLSARELVA